MTTVLSILASDILPIFAIAAIGFFLERRLPGTVKPLSAIAFNALSPCLIFGPTRDIQANGLRRRTHGCFLCTPHADHGGLGRLGAMALDLDRRTLSSFLLVAMFSNSGNYALPLILFAFGTDALAYASVYFVTSAILVYTLGVFIAASGRGQEFRRALKGIFARNRPLLRAWLAAGAIVLLKRQPHPWRCMPSRIPC
jgi:predicted permease